MKQSLLLLFAAAIVMASCHKSKTVEIETKTDSIYYTTHDTTNYARDIIGIWINSLDNTTYLTFTKDSLVASVGTANFDYCNQYNTYKVYNDTIALNGHPAYKLRLVNNIMFFTRFDGTYDGWLWRHF